MAPPPASSTDMPVLTDEQLQALSSLMNITMLDRDVVLQLLHNYRWNEEAALNAHLDSTRHARPNQPGAARSILVFIPTRPKVLVPLLLFIMSIIAYMIGGMPVIFSWLQDLVELLFHAAFPDMVDRMCEKKKGRCVLVEG